MSEKLLHELRLHAKKARAASLALRALPAAERARIVRDFAASLGARAGAIFAANKADMAEAREKNAGDKTAEPLLKRLAFDEAKLSDTLRMLEAVAGLPDLVFAPRMRRELAPHLTLTQRLVPLGVVGFIFESRPDALAQMASLCIKSANGLLFKGGSEASRTNTEITASLADALSAHGLVAAAHMLRTREEAQTLMRLESDVDVLIPRGSKEFVAHIMRESSVPVLGHADGVCHLYIHRDADLSMAKKILFDSKMQHYAVCNAVECALVHTKSVIFLPQLFRELFDAGVTIHADTDEAYGILRAAGIACVKATAADWGAEYLDKEIAVKIVADEHEAVRFINTHGSHHTDAIVTKDEQAARYFQNAVDSSSVLWNCSTRFADGYRYGLGAEVGISTSRLHARGPMGMEGLFTQQWIVDGNGDIVQDFADGAKKFTHKDLS